MTLTPSSIDDLSRIIVAHPRLRVRGGGSKTALSRPRAGEEILELAKLSGVVEHTPEECTFTALAGTPLREIESRLARHGQYLPFDPPFAARGATIGGTVAAALNGSCRYRYGGVRDFLIGARIVDGRGREIRSGGKVVKNAAGFLLHQSMCGSRGQFGVLAEVTFKVFPRAAEYATVVAPAGGAAEALALMTHVQQARFDLEALDIDVDSMLLVRLGGAPDGMPQRVERLLAVLGANAQVLRGEAEAGLWQDAREFGWAEGHGALVRVSITPAQIPALERVCGEGSGRRRYALGGHVAFIAWPGDIEALSRALEQLSLGGLVLIGDCARATIGAVMDDEFARRVRLVMDPDRRFAYD